MVKAEMAFASHPDVLGEAACAPVMSVMDQGRNLPDGVQTWLLSVLHLG